MMGIELGDFFDEYDFMDSILFKIETFDFLSKVVVEIDYYWDYIDNSSLSTIFVFEFYGCYSIKSKISKDVIKSIEKGDNIFSYFTLIKIECENNHCISFFNDFNSEPFLKIEFERIKIYKK